MSIVLHQFAFSHFNEKVRWALAYKNIPHERTTYLPGPHMGPIKRMTGQSATPVLEMEQEHVAGSAQIIQRLEVAYPAVPLIPTAQDEAQAALTWLKRLDEELGPATRAPIFDILVNELVYLAKTFGSQTHAIKRLGYLTLLPLVRPLMKKGNGVTPEKVKVAREVVQDYLTEISNASSATGYLVGQQFTVADLTAAALLAPLMSVAHEDMKRPQPMPAALEDLQAQYADHPAILWAGSIYNQHRESGRR